MSKGRINRPKQIRTFRCPECGAVMSAPKYKARTNAGHVKTMYCYRCKADRDFIQVDRLEDAKCTSQQTIDSASQNVTAG